MSYYDKYVNLSNAYGNSISQQYVNNTARFINATFNDSPYLRHVKLNYDNTLVDVKLVQVAKPGQDFETNSLLFRPFQKFNRGDVVHFQEPDAQTPWIIVDTNYLDELSQRADIEYCNTSLKWINDKGQIIEHYCHVKPRYLSPISITQSSSEMYIPGENTRFAIVQNNADTLSIKRDQRFIFDNKAWKVVGTDSTTYTNLIYVTLFEQDINTATDNTTLRIADYYTKLANYTLSILNGSTSSINVGNTLQLNTQVMNNGVVVTGETIVYTSSNLSIATIDANGLVTGQSNGSVTITASLADSPSITATISLSVSAVVTNNYSVSITSTSATPTEIKNGQSKTYNANVYNNSVQITDGSQPVTWSVFGDDKVSTTTLATITSQTGSSCTVQNNNVTTGYIQLKATLASDGTVIGWLRIQMKSLIY